MTSRDIRRQFLDFFASKGHKIIPSAPMVAKSDPTLMFINSGMAPLKDFFLGNQTPPAKRIADTQKCLRVTGKHNDLEDVGFDGYHHTMFEMLGNWSFGDYFKKDALAWSWELLTDVYKIPKDRLYVSVFGGDEAENLPFDQEAYDTWKQFVAEDRIIPFGKKENFWEMGAQGPCGPCSEIHVDLRSDEERAKTDGRTLVNADDPNVIEVWNNVFMQFNRKADGSLEELPAKSVDTGMGFERLCRAVQGTRSNYDTDLWLPLFTLLESLSGITYTGTYPGIEADWKKTDVAMRVVADHLRAVSFAIADGELPSNTGAGYVIRRILRRAVRYYYSFLNLREPVLYQLCPVLAEEFADVFPELQAQIDFVVKVILEEEKSFLRTLESGLKRMENIEVQNQIVSGEQAFELLDTFGFPIDLTRLIAREKGWSVDDAGFDQALAAQKARSRKDAAKEVGDWVVLTEESDIAFVGYDDLESRDAHIVKYRTVVTKGEEQYQLVLNRTPFYPEGGGQVGDQGWMTFGTEKIGVLDTKKENTLIIHVVEKLPYDLENQAVACQVNVQKRQLTENNHSATHLLHAALRRVLGSHVQQKGSYLDEQALRFDFAHFQKVSEQELAEIERIVNEKIRENIALEEARNLPLEEAKKSGAMMLFGEKYGDTVRMITFDPTYSRELCGGCHVRSTGQIGYFKITAEAAVSAGVRRLEAVTAEGAEQYVAELQQEYLSVKNVLKTKDVVKGVMALVEGRKQLEKRRDELYQWQASRFLGDLKEAFEEYQGVNLLVRKISLDDVNVVKTLAQNLETVTKDAIIVLGFETTEKAQLSIRISENLVKGRGMHAGKMVQELTKSYLDGGGGGQPTFAMGSGSNKAGLEAALTAVKSLVPDENQAKVGDPSERRDSYRVPFSNFSKVLLNTFARQPFETHYKHPAWKYFTSKSTEFQRKTILNQGRVDFTKAYTDQDLDFTLQPYELVDLYSYYYMQMHYASSLAMFSVLKDLVQTWFLDNKDLLFIDFGCGPMTSGAAFVEFHNQLLNNTPLRMYYVGFDNSQDMLEKAQQVATAVKPYVPQSLFNFASEEMHMLELVKDFDQYFRQHEQTAVVINLCYVMAATWFDAEENLKKFADLMVRVTQDFKDQSVCLIYQNPVYGPWHHNWEKLKSLLQERGFGNSKKRVGVINFAFDDLVGSWGKNLPNPNVRFEWFFNETV